MLKFFDAIKNQFNNKSKSLNAFNRLQAGESIQFTPKSYRYTTESSPDTNLDKKWKPETAEEKKSLTPEGFFRQGDRKTRRSGFYEAVFNAQKASGKSDEQAKETAQDALISDYNEKNISIDSTALRSIDYDPWNRILGVKFQNNGTHYQYSQVPPGVVAELMKAPSKGEYFMQNIHDQFTLNPGHFPSNARQKQQYKNYFDMVRKVAAQAKKEAKAMNKKS